MLLEGPSLRVVANIPRLHVLLLELPEEVLLHIVMNVLRCHALHITKGELLLGIAGNVLGWHMVSPHILERELHVLLLELMLEEAL
jgi:hypothetical protein